MVRVKQENKGGGEKEGRMCVWWGEGGEERGRDRRITIASVF